MRNANLLISFLGIVAVGGASAMAWRWRRTPLLADRLPADSPGRAALDGVRTLSVAMSAGILAGALVPGVGGRLVMRILAATSGDRAQGARTDADEVVGRISRGGSLGVVVFVGILSGVLAGLAFLIVRRWLPRTAGRAGLVGGILLLGTIGVGDAMSPDNRDFALLRPTWLALTLIVALALLFGVTLTALAARLDAGMPPLSGRPSSIASHASLVVFAFPLLFIAGAAYVSGRAVSDGQVRQLIDEPAVQRAGRIIVAGSTVVAGLLSIRAIAEILSA